jgi:hypothetical protein
MKSFLITKANKPITLIISIVLATMLCSMELQAQPYIDVFTVRYFYSPEIGNPGKDKNSTRLDYFNFSLTLPFQFKNKKDALILSPFLERWNSQVESISGYKDYHYGLALPVGFLKSIPHSNWTILTTAIFRMNDANINFQGETQWGGYILASWQRTQSLNYKLGLYINSEFFGLFVIPLIGLDWKINDRFNLFGVLPASLTLEYKLSKHFFSGTVFRTFTNSYHDVANQYMRVDENQLGLFLDYYYGKSWLFNIEAGHSILRKLRGGEWRNINQNWNAADNFYFKCMIAYRLRFR